MKKNQKKENKFYLYIWEIIGFLIVIILLYNLPLNKFWINDRIIPYWKSIKTQYNKWDNKYREIDKFGEAQYNFYSTIKANVKKDEILLMPPKSWAWQRLKDNPLKEAIVDPNLMFYRIDSIKVTDIDVKDINYLSKVSKTIYMDQNGENIQLVDLKDEQLRKKILDEFLTFRTIK